MSAAERSRWDTARGADPDGWALAEALDTQGGRDSTHYRDAAASEIALQHAREMAIREVAGGPYRVIYDTHPADEAIRLAVALSREATQLEAGQ